MRLCLLISIGSIKFFFYLLQIDAHSRINYRDFGITTVGPKINWFIVLTT